MFGTQTITVHQIPTNTRIRFTIFCIKRGIKQPNIDEQKIIQWNYCESCEKELESEAKLRES